MERFSEPGRTVGDWFLVRPSNGCTWSLGFGTSETGDSYRYNLIRR